VRSVRGRRIAEPVPDAADRDDRSVWRDHAQLAPHTHDVLIQRVVVHDGAVRPGRADELATAQDRRGASGERGEQAKLGRHELHAATRPGRGVRRRIERQAVDMESPRSSLPERRRSACRRTTSSTNANGFVT
jgi:hypothetical protein